MASTASFARLTSLLAVALVALSVGCKPGARDYCERFVQAQCRFQYSCCNAAERQQAFGQTLFQLHHDEASCVEELTRAACSIAATYADAEQNGRATWDYEKANGCLADLEAAVSACDASGVIGAAPEGCSLEDFIAGTVEDDETCFGDFECANPEASCEDVPVDEEEEDPPVVVTAKGVCTAPPDIGEECPDGFCTEAGWCDNSEDPPVCKAKLDNGDECSSPVQCESGICDFSVAPSVCSPKKPVGASCFSHLECASAFCDFVSGQCEDKRENGEPCSEDAGCESGNCDFASGECTADDDEDIIYDICLANEA